MSETKKRNVHLPEFKAKVGLEAFTTRNTPATGFTAAARMVVYLGRCGHTVNRKRAQRLMRTLGLAGMAPGPNTSRAHPRHKAYPYLLRGVAVERPNQVWSADITYIRLARGFALSGGCHGLVLPPGVLSGRISNTMEAMFCVECLEDALRIHGKPEVFNSEQGSQFTSAAFTDALKREDVYLNGYATMEELLIGLTQYFAFYNGEQMHQSLGNKTPDAVYASASGGGALIVDKYASATGLPIALGSTRTAFDEGRLEISGMQNTKNRGSAVQLCVKSSAT